MTGVHITWVSPTSSSRPHQPQHATMPPNPTPPTVLLAALLLLPPAAWFIAGMFVIITVPISVYEVRTTAAATAAAVCVLPYAILVSMGWVRARAADVSQPTPA